MINPASAFMRALVCVVAVAGIAPARSDKSASGPPVQGELGTKIDDYMTRLEAYGFSGTLLVAKGNSVILAKGYGLADRSRGIPMTADTVISIGSITKQFTAAAILKLEMQGKLSVSDPITKYFPKVPPDKAGITLHHLLTHTAGLDEDYGGSDYEEVSRDEILRRVLTTPLKSELGKRHLYSNAGYSLLGAIVEIVSGQNYERYLYENLFKPAGMLKTGYKIPNWSRDEIARGYIRGQDWGTILERPWAGDGPYWNLRANGGIHSTIGDMYKWHVALEGEALLSIAAKKKYYEPYVAEGPRALSFYSYGWSIENTPRGKLITHNGGNGIFAADFLRYVDAGVVIYIASNVAEMKSTSASRPIAKIVFGEDYTLPPKTVKLEPAMLGRYAGTYSLQSGATIIVSIEGGRLMIAPGGQEAFGLLMPGDQGERPRLAQLSARTATIIENAAKGDFGPLKEALSPMMPRDQVEKMQAERWKERLQRYGAFKRAAVIGTTLDEEGDATTFVQLEFERGSESVQYIWGPRGLAGFRSSPGIPGNVVLAESPTDFASFDLDSKKIVRVSFKVDDKGSVTGLVVRAKSGGVAASKVK